MRIRRRPQPSPLHQASDPSTSASSPSYTPQNAARPNGGCLDGDDGEEGRPHADADLVGQKQKSGVARRLALPQDNAVHSGVSVSAGQGAGDVVHMRCGAVEENGHHGWDEKDSATWTGGAVGSTLDPAAANKVVEEEERASNGALRAVAPAAAAVAVKKGEAKVVGKNGSVVVVRCANNKKRRGGPAVLLEGSRCSRVNGRGWRCSQPTLVGYSLCEHHLGKGRRAWSGGGARGGGPGQLGRTEHGARVTTVAAAGAPNGEGRL